MQVNSEAVENLAIFDVTRREETVSLHPHFEPILATGQDEIPVIHQIYFHSRDLVIGEGIQNEGKENGDKGERVCTYHFRCQGALRFLSEGAKDEDGSILPDEEITDFIRAELKCLFVAHYASKVEISKEAITKFHQENVPYHIWPYWREWIQTTCLNYRLPNVVLGFYRVQEHNTGD